VILRISSGERVRESHRSFEDALRLRLSLGQEIATPNSDNCSRKDGRESAVNLCVHTDESRITIYEGKIKSEKC